MKIGFISYDFGPGNHQKYWVEKLEEEGHECFWVNGEDAKKEMINPDKILENDIVCIGSGSFDNNNELNLSRVLVEKNIPYIMNEDIVAAGLRVDKELVKNALGIVTARDDGEMIEELKSHGWKEVWYLGEPSHFEKEYKAVINPEIKNIFKDKTVILYPGNKIADFNNMVIKNVLEVIEDLDNIYLCFTEHVREVISDDQKRERLNMLESNKDRVVSDEGYRTTEIMPFVEIVLQTTLSTMAFAAASAHKNQIMYYTKQGIEDIKLLGLEDGRHYLEKIGAMYPAYDFKNPNLKNAIEDILNNDMVREDLKIGAEKCCLIPEVWEQSDRVVKLFESF